jgi:uncharacterized protein
MPFKWLKVNKRGSMIREEQVYIKNNTLLIDGLLSRSAEDKGVMICHPHSLMGGSMHNNVVEAIQEAFAEEEYTTLRFNFRGVGRSTGNYDEGKGEQEDIIAAGKYLQSIGIPKISFAGYSFGSWVGSKVIERYRQTFADVIFVSPPINYFDFNFSKLSNEINMMICGDTDQYCDLNVLRKQINNLNTNLQIITDADHFYLGREKEIINILRTSLNNQKN